MTDYDNLIEAAGQKYNVDPALLRAVMSRESGGNPNAVSSKGAAGLMQLMPATAKQLGVTDINDPAQNIMAGARYLSQQLDKYGDVPTALAAYNAGPGAVDKAGGIPNYPETQKYVSTIMGQYDNGNAATTPQKAQAKPASTGLPDSLAARLGNPGSAQSGLPASLSARLNASAPASQPAAATATPQPTQPAAAPGNQSVFGNLLTGTKNAIAGGVHGIVSPLQGVAQMVEHGVQSGLNYVAPNSGAANYWNGVVKNDDAALAQQEAQYQKNTQGSTAAPIANFIGEMAAPGKVAGKVIGAAKGVIPLVVRGAAAGAGAGVMQPVTSSGPDAGTDYWSEKLSQAGAGAIGGAVLTPAIAKIVTPIIGAAVNKAVTTGNKLVNAVNPASAATIETKTNAAMNQVAADLNQQGIDISQIPQNILANVRTQVGAALKTGKQVDPATLLRAADFESLGMKPTLGQITRDPTQFTTEKNLRSVANAGEPLMQRFNEQNNQLLAKMNGLGAQGATDADVAGNQLINRLQNLDKPTRQAVGSAYDAARNSSGRPALMDAQGFVTEANDVLDHTMLGSVLPKEARDLMNNIALGKTPFDVNNAVQVDSILSGLQRTAMATRNGQGAKAIGVVRDALNNAEIQSAEGQAAKAAFDTARGMARNRFATIAQTPALDAALHDAVPDTFVRKYILSAPSGDVNALAKYMRPDAEATATARAQIAGFLKNKAFGENMAGDTPFAQASYNRALKSLGVNKLTAFFSPEEVNQLQAIGRVGAYISSQPAGSAVNNSNTAGAAMNLLSSLGGGVGKLPLANAVRNSFRQYGQERAVQNALQARVNPQAAELPPEVTRSLQYLLPSAVGASSSFIGSR